MYTKDACNESLASEDLLNRAVLEVFVIISSQKQPISP